MTGVYAEIHYRADPDGLDDDVFIALTHESGVRSQLWGSCGKAPPARGSAPPGPRRLCHPGRRRPGSAAAQRRFARVGGTSGDQWGTEPPERWGHLARGDVSEVYPQADHPHAAQQPEQIDVAAMNRKNKRTA